MNLEKNGYEIDYSYINSLLAFDKLQLNNLSQIFISNEAKKYQVSKAIFKYILENKFTSIQVFKVLQIWLISDSVNVYQQLLQFLEDYLQHTLLDNDCINQIFEILGITLQKIKANLLCFIDKKEDSEELLELNLKIFHIIWDSLESQTENQYFEKKNELWMQYIWKLNDMLAPLTADQIQFTEKVLVGVYIILHNLQVSKKYITPPRILLNFIYILFPLQYANMNWLISNLISSSAEFLIDSNLKQDEQYPCTIEKVLKSVSLLNVSMRQKIFQLIWTRWNIEEDKNALQCVINTFLNDQQLGTKNNFFYSILTVESSKKIVHPFKFKALLQIYQCLCLENAPIDINQIVQTQDSLAQCLFLKQYKISNSFQTFFQVNQYYSMIIELINGITNTTNLIVILKEFIKLAWLLTEGLTINQIEFTEDFITFLEGKLFSFTDEQMKEIIELLLDCSVSMVSKIMRDSNPTNLDYMSEILIQNEFCLKVLVEVFVLNCEPSEALRLNTLQWLARLIQSNEYNQMIFRQSNCLSDFLMCMVNQRNKNLQKSMEEVLKLSLSFTKNDQINKLIQNAAKDPQRNKMFRQSAFSQYVGTTLENLSNNINYQKGRKQFQFLGKDSGIVIKNFSDFSHKNKKFTIFIEFKREGLYFINSNAKSKNDIIKKKQILLNISGQIEKNEKNTSIQNGIKSNLQTINLLSVYLSNESALREPMETQIIVQILDDQQQVQPYTLNFKQMQEDESILLMLMYEKNSFLIKTNRVETKVSQIKCFFFDYNKKYQQKNPLTLTIGGQNDQQQLNKCFQGQIQGVIFINSKLTQQQINNIYLNNTSNLVEIIEREVMNLGQDDTDVKEMQYLDMEKLKSSLNMVEIKEAFKIIKAQNIQDTNFLINMIKKQSQFKKSQESNTSVKIFYSGLNVIEDVSLAEVFLSLENMQIILFIIQITTQVYFEADRLQRKSTRFKTLKTALNNPINEGGVYKRKKYFDQFLRQGYLTKDLNKSKFNYMNSQQYQLNLMNNQNSSTISQGESPTQQRRNFLNMEYNVNSSFQGSLIMQQQLPQTSQFAIESGQGSLFNIPMSQVQLNTTNVKKALSNFHEVEKKRHFSPPLNYTKSIEKSAPDRISIQNFPITEYIGRSNKRRVTEQHNSAKDQLKIQCDIDVQSEKGIVDEKKKIENFKEQSTNMFYCEWIRVKMAVFGELKILENGKLIEFQSDAKERPEEEIFCYGTIPFNLRLAKIHKIIHTNTIQEIQTRRYSHKEIAIEIFCKNSKSYFFVLYDIEKRQKFINQIKSTNPLINIVIDRRAEFLAKDYTKKWCKNKISNFEYLMLINKYSGRSFNDLNQYPIFPWVICDYSSKSIDLNDRMIYRDLEKMISVMNKDRLENCKQRAESLKQTQSEYFLFGSHYSVAAQIINTLVRIEPFTTLQCELQDGKFDQPDRLYFSIPNTWTSCLQDNQDYRELIPEYFYLPEFLNNVNEIEFGQRQNGEIVSDVLLPPWASTSEAFIDINRRALESNYVSEKLHCWINYVFGIFSQGEEAKKRDNLYHWLSYDTCLNEIEKLPFIDRQGYLSQIQQFGQVPYQLFTKSHQQKTKFSMNLFTPEQFIKIFTQKKIQDPKRIMKFDKKLAIKLYKEGENVYTLLNNKQIIKLKYNQAQERRDSEEKLTNNFHIAIGDVEKLHLDEWNINKEYQTPQKIPSKHQKSNHPSGLQFQFCQNYLFVSGYISGAVYIFNLNDDKQQASHISKVIKLHKKRVTCLWYESENKLLALGSKDARVTIWKLNYTDNKQIQLYTTPKLILYGHDKTIKCVYIDRIEQTVVSIDKSGKLLIYSIINGLFLKEIKFDLMIGDKIWQVKSNENGLIVLLTQYSEIIVTRRNGLIIRKYQYNNIGDITQISIYQQSHLLISTIKGEILLMRDIGFLEEQHPIIFHIYQNTSGVGIVTFYEFLESETNLTFLISLTDGSILRFCITTEENSEFNNYLGRLGM